MSKVSIVLATTVGVALSVTSVVQAEIPPLRAKNKGVQLSGVVFNMDCQGAGITCSKDSSIQLQVNVPNVGTVTSISQGTGMSFSVNPITSTGTINLATPVTLANGGTNAALTADNGAIVYSSASAHAHLASTATASRVLMSGASAAPVWSTPVYPNASALSGTYIKSDGTNYIASTGSASGVGTPTACSNQFVTGLTLSSDAAPTSTCTTDTLASAQHANQGTTTQVLHGNAAGNPSWSQISLTADVTGVLPIANGGTNNSAAYTAGSVIFSNGTSLTQNNAQLFWDNTNNRLGIGTASPARTLDIVQGVIESTFAGATNLAVPFVFFRRSEGTAAAPTVILNGDNIMSFISYGYDGANFQQAATIVSSIDGATISSTSMPGRLMFNTTPSGSTTPSERMRIDNAGNVGIGTVSPADKLEVSGSVGIRTRISSTDNLLAGLRIRANSTDWFIDNRALSDTPNNRLAFFDNSGTERFTILQTGLIGIGASSPQATLDLQGSFRTITTSTSANLSLTTAHQTILATTGAGGITLTLPAASANTIGLIYYCVKVDSGGGALTIAAAGTDTVNGAASKTLATQYATARVVGISATAWAADNLGAL